MSEETFIDRVEARIAALGMTDRQVSLLATGKPDLIRDARRRGIKPKGDAMEKLADVLETTVEFLVHGRTTGRVLGERRSGYDAEPSDLAWPRNRTMPVYGTALGGGEKFGDEIRVETHIIEQSDVIDWIRRPVMLEGRKDVYALYIHGSSMEPRFDSGDPVIVDPKRPPAPGDDVIVQLKHDNGDGAEETFAALIKTLVKRTAQHLELKQYNPPLSFIVPLDRVANVHRVIPRRDLVG